MNVNNFYITPEEYDRAALIGVDGFNLERRIRSLCWKKEKAITTPLRKVTNRSHWAKVAKQNGIIYRTFMSRVTLYGWDEERAATEPLQDRKAAAANATEYIRKTDKDVIRMAQENGLSRQMFRQRIRKGWDPVRAATQPPLTLQQIGRIGAHNMHAKYGDLGRVYLKRGKKHTFSREILTPDNYPTAHGT